MTRQEYADYETAVAEFLSHGLRNLSAVGDNPEPFFSWRPCQCCGDSLGGNRYECNGYNGVTKEIETFDSICGDCVYYAAYGRLDDMTMIEIERAAE